MNNREIADVPLNLIDLGANVRESISADSVSGLRQTAEKRGIREPVTLQRSGQRYVLIKGFRRFLTAQSLGHSSIPAMIVDSKLSEADVLAEQLTENLQRLDLTDMEKARGIDGFMRARNCTASLAAEELGLTTAQVSKLRSLLTLAPTVQEMVVANQLPAGTAIEIARAGDPEMQIRLAKEAVEKRLSRDAVASKVKATKRPAQNSVKPATRAMAILGGGRSVTVAGPELSLDRFVEWLEELLGKARRARPKGLELNTFIKMLRDQSKREATEGTSC